MAAGLALMEPRRGPLLLLMEDRSTRWTRSTRAQLVQLVQRVKCVEQHGRPPNARRREPPPSNDTGYVTGDGGHLHISD